MIRLTAVIELEGQAPRALTHESNAPQVVLGRDPSADFQIPLTTISRHHTRISETDGVYVIEDLGSTHGTILNGRKLQKGEKKVLRNGDILELTHAKVTCAIEEDQVASAEPGEATQEIAAKAIDGILGRLGDAEETDVPFVRALNGADEGKRFPLGGTLSEWTIGRSKDCEVLLNDPNVSRRHATIRKDWNGFVIHDLGSKNGVVVNDRRIKKPRRLKDSDELIVGPIKLVFVDPNAELLAALKDVPGFELDEAADNEELEGDPSVMGAPADGEQPQSQQQEADVDAEADAQPEGEAQLGDNAEAMAEPADLDDSAAADQDDELEDIDAALLQEPVSKFPIEWVVIGIAGSTVVVAAILLFIILA